MATYNFSTLIASGDKSQAFTSTDILVFDGSIDASALIITTSGANITIKLATGNTLTLLNFNKFLVAAANFQFDNGSQLFLGDGTTFNTTDTAANTLISSDFNDYLDGLGGVDTVSYETASSGVTVDLSINTAQDTQGAGIDKLINIENITGSVFEDTLTGTAGANTLDGGAGIDTLEGGSGNDIYVVTAGDTVLETSTGGVDTIITSGDYTLTAASNIEKLTLTGAANSHAIGAASVANTLVGNSGNNVLSDGGAGVADTMTGGDGNDTYIVNNVGDIIIETNSLATQIDLVQARVSISALAANIENLRLMGATAINGKGNALDNIIYANTGTNTLDGDAGNDTLSYQYGAKSAVTVSLAVTTAQTTGGSGTDKLSNFENIVGSNFNDVLTGNANSNVINGGVGNDTINGGASSDTLIGGKGNDSYFIDASTDVVIELFGDGTDTVNSSVTYSLNTSDSVGVENLVLTAGDINGTGNSFANTLTGSTGNNILDGLAGIDTMIGLAGDDTYIVDSTSDSITEVSGAGTDSVFSTATYTLSVNVENLTLTGAIFINGTGNSLANTLTGNTTNNILSGFDGNDILNGGAGQDTLTGGTGADTFIFNNSSDSNVISGTADIITDFAKGTDKIDVSAIFAAGLLSAPTALLGAFTGSGSSGEVIAASSGVNLTTVSGDVDGDAVADFAILLTGFTGGLTTNDFIFS